MKLRHDMLTHGVNVVTARDGERIAGLAVAWATQVATDHVLICVGSQSATRELILASKAFGLSVLRADQLEISRTFGTKSSRDVNKFEGLAHHAAETESPLLDDCVAAFDCRVENTYKQASGEILFVGRIVAAEINQLDAERLIYCGKDYS